MGKKPFDEQLRSTNIRIIPHNKNIRQHACINIKTTSRILKWVTTPSQANAVCKKYFLRLIWILSSQGQLKQKKIWKLFYSMGFHLTVIVGLSNKTKHIFPLPFEMQYHSWNLLHSGHHNVMSIIIPAWIICVIIIIEYLHYYKFIVTIINLWIKLSIYYLEIIHLLNY